MPLESERDLARAKLDNRFAAIEARNQLRESVLRPELNAESSSDSRSDLKADSKTDLRPDSKPDLFRPLQASERTLEPVDIRKGDGALVTLKEGCVSKVVRGGNSLEIDYEREDGIIKRSQDGQPIVSKIRTSINGVENELDLTASQRQVRVGQKEAALGNIAIMSGDRTVVLTTEFNKVEKHGDRIVAIERPSGAVQQYFYDQGNKLNKVIETYRTSSGQLVTQMSERVGDSEKFVVRSDNGAMPAWRSAMRVRDDGELAFKELNERFFTPAKLRDQSESNLGDIFAFQSTREDFIKNAARFGVFKGSEAETLSWMNRFESRALSYGRRGWMGANQSDVAATYDNLSKILTAAPVGRARVVGTQERRLLVESALKELADPARFINQGSIGTCSLNAVESNLARRKPQELTRWLKEASTMGYVTSAGTNRAGEKVKVPLTEAQLNYEPSWNRSYSNQIFQFAAIAALGYRSRGYDYRGTTNQQLNYVSRLACGTNMGILDNWMGYGARKADIIGALKTRGSVAYIVPGHCMAIDDYDPVKDRFYVNNWWGGSRDGWYSPRNLGLR